MLEKDYTLLRPFDMDAAKRGEAICFYDGLVLQDVTITKLGSICGRWSGDSAESIWSGAEIADFRMAPLCWVEGKPVYSGDVLYRPAKGTQGFVADRIYRGGNGDVYLIYENEGASWLEGPEWTRLEEMWNSVTWTPPKVKREGFVCITRPHSVDAIPPSSKLADVIVRNGWIFATREAAQAWADTCKDVVRIVPLTWEESVQHSA